MMKPQTERLALSTREAAATIGLSQRTLQKYIQTGRLPARRIGRRTLITVEDLQLFLNSDQELPVDHMSARGSR